jgi:hypothetical protein
MVDSPYVDGYDAWEAFDALPVNIRRAHQTVFTGNVVRRNQYDARLCLTDLTESDAVAILEIDNGKQLTGAFDLCGKTCFS